MLVLALVLGVRSLIVHNKEKPLKEREKEKMLPKHKLLSFSQEHLHEGKERKGKKT